MDLPAHQLTMTVPMTPDTANLAGNVHGRTIPVSTALAGPEVRLRSRPAG